MQISMISLSYILCVVGCTGGTQRHAVDAGSVSGLYRVEEISVAATGVVKPDSSTKLRLGAAGECELTNWPLSAFAFVPASGQRPTGSIAGKGTWRMASLGGRDVIEMQIDAVPPLEHRSVLVLQIDGIKPVRLRANIDAGSEDDFMILIQEQTK